MLKTVLLAIFFPPALLFCGSDNPIRLDPNVDPVTEGDWVRPNVSDTWQWQLNGEINTTYDVNLYDVDLYDVPDTAIEDLQSNGKIVICHFSAGTYEDHRDDAEFFPEDVKGDPVDGSQDELWLDIRSVEVLAIMIARLDYAIARGCDGVEPDNVDAYTHDTGFNLKPLDQLAFNRTLANAAHERDLAVALKNDGNQTDDLVNYFDFALNEQCHEYEECELYDVFIENEKPVLNAEYNVSAEICSEALTRDFRTLILPVVLDDSSRVSCD